MKRNQPSKTQNEMELLTQRNHCQSRWWSPYKNKEATTSTFILLWKCKSTFTPTL